MIRAPLPVILVALATTISISQAQTWLTNGLVAYYPFNGNANDESGFGDHGVVYHAELTNDRFGATNSAYRFNSQNMAAIQTQGRNLPVGSAPRTYSLWMRAEPKYPSGTFIVASLFEHGRYNWATPTNTWFRGDLVYQGATNLISLDLQTGLPNETWSTWKPNWDYGKWKHMVWAFSTTSNQTALYLDGVQQTFDSSAVTNLTLNTVSNVLYLGYAVAGGKYFDGLLDDVRVYNRVLSASEVAQLFSLESPTNSGPPTITTQPQEQIVARGRDAFFTVSTIGQQPQSYQWCFNGPGLAGATNGVLRVLSATNGNDGLYSVVVSNALGVVTSTPAHLSVMQPLVGGPPPTNGLVAYYPFNGNANDESGFGDNGVVSNAALTADRFGTPNSAYSFNSSLSAQITTAGKAVPTGPGKAKTFTCWFKMPTSSGGGSLWSAGLPGQGNGLAGLIFYVNQDTSGMEVGMWDSGFWTYLPSSDLYGAWHQYVVVIDSASNVSAYLDGEFFSFQTSAPPGTSFNIASAPFIIGHWDGTSRWFDGLIDDVRIYSRALSVQEVYQLYNSEVPAPPVINSQPQSVSTNLGSAVNFTVAATGTNGLWYQWYKDGVPLPSSTNNVLALTSVQPTRIGDYQVIVTGYGGSVTSSVASLTLNGVDSSIWRGLVGYYLFNGNANDASAFGNNGTAQNTMIATNRFGSPASAFYFDHRSSPSVRIGGTNLIRWLQNGTFAYWFRQSPSIVTNSLRAPTLYWGSGDWTPPFLYTEFWITSLQFIGTNGGGYKCYDNPSQPFTDGAWHQLVFSVSPNAIVAYVDGKPITAWVETPPPGMTWPTPNGDIWFGANPAASFEGWLDDLRIFNRALSASEVARLYASEAVPPSITTQPFSRIDDAHSDVYFSVSASGSAPLGYQWSFSGTNLPNATDTTLWVTNITPSSLGAYRVMVTNVAGSVTSTPATLYMNPYIVRSFNGAVTYWGQTNTLSVEAWGSYISYQWYLNGQPIPGAASATLVIPSVQFTNGGMYNVVVSSIFGDASSTPAQLVVNPANVSIKLCPDIVIQGTVGYSYLIQYSTNLSDTNAWTTLTNLTLSQPIQYYDDISDEAALPRRFYRVLPGH